ncbi:MAG TPA: tRNA preQ1(34) S-adenosylmethionine ribosyltransferase-isomerase QueA [Gammaproteobacteria bacterium]|nr:tRNA preQ1(34) S-adenosylmethionine ribosyltransferase-isomerase QueA [Gammaproteobacteria bacterium]
MRRDEFTYDLPAELIAQYPAVDRGESRLLVLDTRYQKIQDQQFSDLPDLLLPGDLLVFNDTRVIPARLYARKESGGRGEVMVERLLDNQQLLAQVRFSKPPRAGTRISLEAGHELEVIERQEEFFLLRLCTPGILPEVIDQIGHMPLPPYIQRDDEITDRDRYQTIYAEVSGAVAAPTAGLHFTRSLLQTIRERGIGCSFVTLHVGAGTFQPVREENIEDHHMHREYLEVSQQVCDQVNQARAKGSRVIAVGTTSVRCLEAAAASGKLLPYTGETDIFIYPGYKFRIVDGLITNFHLPESTLLMLVCALAGKETVLSAYAHAICRKYRFYSYGDAMFISSRKREA